MTTQQPNAWQVATGGRPRHSHSASRTPQNRSGTGSPSQQTTPTQPPRQEGNRGPSSQLQANNATNNVWTQRSSSVGGSNGQRAVEQQTQHHEEQQHTPAHGFNAADVKAALARDVGGVVYKPSEGAGNGRATGGNPWAPKANAMANGQPFFVQLAKQIATLEGGG